MFFDVWFHRMERGTSFAIGEIEITSPGLFFKKKIRLELLRKLSQVTKRGNLCSGWQIFLSSPMTMSGMRMLGNSKLELRSFQKRKAGERIMLLQCSLPSMFILFLLDKSLHGL